MMTHHETSIQTIDTLQFGRPSEGAAYLIRGETTALIETGTAREAPNLCKRLHGKRIDTIFVTHVHLDHAGGAGFLAADHPEATVVAHPRAVRHLVDPSRLVEGVRAASREMFHLYGIPQPIPENRIHAAADGEIFPFGSGLEIEAVHAPGHAPHHICFFERKHQVLFAGDAVGHHNVPVMLPLTVPPRFDRSAGFETLARLKALAPSHVAFTHFGMAEGGRRLIERYEGALAAWLERIEGLASQGDEDFVTRSILSDPQHAEWSDVDRQVASMCIRGALATINPGTS